MAVQVQVLDEKGLPVRCTVAAVRTSDQTILNLYTTDSTTGVASINESGTWYPRPMVDPSYKSRIHLVILNSQDAMNADYVVDSSGGGTHASLKGSSGALAAAMASGVDKQIHVCSSHSETLSDSDQLNLDGMAAGQTIEITSGGRRRGVITCNYTTARGLFIQSTTRSGARVVLRNIALKTTGSNAADLFRPTSGVSAAKIECHNVDFINTWRYGGNYGSVTPGGLVFDNCSGTFTQLWGTAQAQGLAACIVLNSDFTVTHLMERLFDSSPESGSAYVFENNKLTVSDYGLQLTFIIPFTFRGNRITHAYNGQFLKLGTSGSNGMGKVVVTGNQYDGSGGGNSTRFIYSTLGAGSYAGFTCVGNELTGPGGSSKAIEMVGGASGTVAVEPNGFYNWGTNVSGSGATTTFSGPVTIGGVLSADHGGLSGLSDDDHPQYAFDTDLDLYLTADGLTPLTGDWDAGAFQIGGVDTTFKAAAAVGVQVGDEDFNLSLVGGAKAQVRFDDATHDYLEYDRSANKLSLIIGSAAEVYYAVGGDFQVYANGGVGDTGTLSFNGARAVFGYDGSLSVAFMKGSSGKSANVFVNGAEDYIHALYSAGAGTRGVYFMNSVLTTDDKFGFLATDATTPLLSWDGTDYQRYNRGSNYWDWVINSAIVQQLDTNGLRVLGYLGLGSVSAPGNTSAGDATTTRLSVGGSTIPSGEVVYFTGARSDTSSGAKAFYHFVPQVSPASASSSEFRTLYFDALLTDAGGSINYMEGININFRDRSSSAKSHGWGLLVGIGSDSSSPATVGTWGEYIGFQTGILSASSGHTLTATTAYGFRLNSPSGGAYAVIGHLYGAYITDPSGGTVTDMDGLYIADLSSPSGTVYGIRNLSSMKQVGSVGFYGTEPQTKPTVSGSRGGNAALQSLLTALSGLGLLTDSSS